MAWLIPVQRKQREHLDACVFNTFEARLEKPFAPFYIGNPRDAFPRAAGDGVLDQQVATNIVSVRDNHMMLGGVLKWKLSQKVERDSRLVLREPAPSTP